MHREKATKLTRAKNGKNRIFFFVFLKRKREHSNRLSAKRRKSAGKYHIWLIETLFDQVDVAHCCETTKKNTKLYIKVNCVVGGPVDAGVRWRVLDLDTHWMNVIR